MKLLKSLVLALLLIPSACIAKQPYAHNENSIVKVLCQEGSGSATRVGPTDYISVAHVVTLTKCTVNGTPIKATYVNTKQDFATFTGPVGTDFMKVSCDGYHYEEGYVMRGYAYGDDTPWFEPVIFITKDKDGIATFVGNDFPGMSGGPVIDVNGRITGTVNIQNPTGSVDLHDTIVCKRK
jgi:hypothetical protein